MEKRATGNNEARKLWPLLKKSLQDKLLARGKHSAKQADSNAALLYPHAFLLLLLTLTYFPLPVMPPEPPTSQDTGPGSALTSPPFQFSPELLRQLDRPSLRKSAEPRGSLGAHKFGPRLLGYSPSSPT